MPGDPRWGWIGALLVTAFGGFLRFYNLAVPHAVVFDETYYAKDALSLIEFGVERTPVDDADKQLLAGNADIWKQCAADQADQCAAYVVHPPLAKWMIGLGEALFGPRRSAVRRRGGTLSILILARTARRVPARPCSAASPGSARDRSALRARAVRAARRVPRVLGDAGFACRRRPGPDAGTARRWPGAHRHRCRAHGPGRGSASAVADRGRGLPRRPCASKWAGSSSSSASPCSASWDAGARQAVGLRGGTGHVRLRPAGRRGRARAGARDHLRGELDRLVRLAARLRPGKQATTAGPVFFVFDSVRSGSRTTSRC